MCQYIHTDHVMPGYICCIPSCREYNGLQRSMARNGEYRTLCKRYDKTHRPNVDGCALRIEPEVQICANCFAGDTEKGRASLIGNAAGDKAEAGQCFVCKQPLVIVTRENNQRLFDSLYIPEAEKPLDSAAQRE